MPSLPEKMLAVVNYGPKQYKLETVSCPKPGPRDLIVKVEATGICGSDVHCYLGSQMFWGGASPWVKAPVTPGHEFVCRVVEAGSEAEAFHNVKVGDRVIAEQIVPCNKCRFCKSGQYWMCQKHDIYGYQKNDSEGSWAEYMRFNENAIVHRVPEELSMEDAAYVEPLACALHVVQRAQVGFEDIVVLAGAGPLGLGIIQGIKLKTPKKSIVIDLDDARLAKAKKLGADIIINAKKENAVQRILELTQGYGCDVYIEATGHPSGVTQGLEMIRKLGRFIQFSVLGEDVTTDFSVIGDRKEIDLLGAHLGPYCYPVAIDLLQRGLISAKEIVTHKFKLSEFETALKTAQGKEAIKVLMIP